MKNKTDLQWNLKLLYKSSKDPKIEEDVQKIEHAFSAFAKKYDVQNKEYLTDENALFKALTDYEKLLEDTDPKPIFYFYRMKDMDSSKTEAAAKLSLITNRLTQSENKITFFPVSLGTIAKADQEKFLKSESLAHFKVLLSRIFDDAKHHLSVNEENILNLMQLPAFEMWVMGNEKLLNSKTVTYKGRKISLPESYNLLKQIPGQKDRMELSMTIAKELASVAPFSEAEINAVMTNKKIGDTLKGFKTPYEQTIRFYRNDPEVVMQLVNVVTKSFRISQKFYKLKAKLLKLNNLNYADRSAKFGTIKTKFPFEISAEILKAVFGTVNAKYTGYIDRYIKDGQIDVFPRVGKHGGAYCSHIYGSPTMLLLNHTDDFYSFTTLAHELGHAFHGELSRAQGPIYANYSIALAETASTLFESLAAGAVFEELSDKEKIIALHDKIDSEMATVFRQIACFNFENDLNNAVRTKGYVSKEEIADLHNKNMSAYLGPIFKMRPEDGYMFVQWSHIRRFFYVYTYAFGLLVSKALLRKYKADSTFWASIEKFLSSGGKDSPENILLEIGIDVRKPEFWQEGLSEIEDDIKLLEKLTSANSKAPVKKSAKKAPVKKGFKKVVTKKVMKKGKSK